MKNKVTQKDIDAILKASKFEVTTVFDKCTVVAMQLPNGFILVESSACVDPKNYDKDQGVKLCEKRLVDKLWELEGYVLQSNLAEAVEPVEDAPEEIKAEPKLVLKLVNGLGKSYVGTVGIPTNYKDANGNKLSVGDVVKISIGCYSEMSIVVIDNGKPFVMGIGTVCDSETGHIDDNFIVEKVKSYRDIKVGENYWRGFFGDTIRVCWED